MLVSNHSGSHAAKTFVENGYFLTASGSYAVLEVDKLLLLLLLDFCKNYCGISPFCHS